MTVYASDIDGAAFTFSLASSQFVIDSTTGIVTVADPAPTLDREVITIATKKYYCS